MSQPTTPADNTVPTYQFQFQQPYPLQYPMSQAQQQQLHQQMQAQQQATAVQQQPVTVQQVQTPPTPQSQPTSTQYQASAQTPLAGPSNSVTTTPTATQPAASQQQQQTPQTQPPAQSSRSAAELARKDRTLAEFMLMLDDYEPLIPNEVTDYYLQRVGFETDDVRLKRLLALAAQKFVSDIAADAYQHARIRTNATASGRNRGPGGGQSVRDKTRTTLTMEDLSAALSEYGINARKPEFYM